MKRSTKVSSSRRTQRKLLYAAPSNIRRKIMSCRLSKENRAKHQVRSLPIRKNDVVKVLKGKAKNKTGKVTAVYRRKWVIHVDKITREKQNQQPVNIPIKPSNCVIETIHLDKDRKDLIERASKAAKNIKNKVVTKN
jgi:large subunit ribosomal protein L26e